MKDRIKEIRKSQGMTQEEFADAVGKSRAVLASYEVGRVQPDEPFIRLLALQYGYRVEWIRDGTLPKKAEIPLGLQLSEIAGAAAANSANVEAVRKFFREIGDTFTDGEILLLYQIFRKHFGGDK